MRQVIQIIAQGLVVSFTVAGMFFCEQKFGISSNWFIASITGGIAVILIKLAIKPKKEV